MKDNINFNHNAILEKEFATSWKGYDAEEVDLFFDKVIQDYMMFEEIIKQNGEESLVAAKQQNALKEEIKSLHDRIKILEEENKKLKSDRYNIDVMEKLNALEKKISHMNKVEAKK